MSTSAHKTYFRLSLAPLALALTLAQPLAASEQNAEDLVQAGLSAMKQWEDDPMQGVEATINLIKARDIYQAGENWDKVQELNAHIFWCKKKMTNDQIDSYLALLKNDAGGNKKAAAKQERAVKQA